MTILVTGATKGIGRRIVDHLIDLGANDIRALTKNPAEANLPDSVRAVTGYLGDPESLTAAFEGVERMYLAPLPKTLDATLELARQANVEYVVALSGEAHWRAHADAVAWTTSPCGPPRSRHHAQCGSHTPRPLRRRSRWTTSPGWLRRCWSNPTSHTSGGAIRSPGPRCDRVEAEAEFQQALGPDATWYLDQVEGAVNHPQDANDLVADLTGTPAQSVAQWAAANAELFR
jgi:hypothetical protein